MARFTDADRLRWVYEGQWVWAPDRRTLEARLAGRGIRCQVTKACGTMAYVEQPKHDFAGWFDVLDLFPADPPPDGPRGGGEPIPEPLPMRAAA